MGRAVRPGISTWELDQLGRALLEREGARPGARAGLRLPRRHLHQHRRRSRPRHSGPRLLQEGQLVNIDVSAELDGYFADTGGSFPVDAVSEQKTRLYEAARNALTRGLAVARAGQPLSGYGRVVENEARRHGFKVIENLSGHGVGRKLHEPPHDVACHFDRRNKERFTEGAVLTLEPFLSTGARKVVTAKDGWTQKTPDRSVTAQYEHTIVITKSRPIVLTACWRQRRSAAGQRRLDLVEGGGVVHGVQDRLEARRIGNLSQPLGQRKRYHAKAAIDHLDDGLGQTEVLALGQTEALAVGQRWARCCRYSSRLSGNQSGISGNMAFSSASAAW